MAHHNDTKKRPRNGRSGELAEALSGGSQSAELGEIFWKSAWSILLLGCCRAAPPTRPALIEGVWIGGVSNGYFRESEKDFSEAEIYGIIPESPQKERFSPNFRLRNLEILGDSFITTTGADASGAQYGNNFS